MRSSNSNSTTDGNQKVVGLAREAGYSDNNRPKDNNPIHSTWLSTKSPPPRWPWCHLPRWSHYRWKHGRWRLMTIRLAGTIQILDRCTKILHDKFESFLKRRMRIGESPSLRMSSRVLGKIFKRMECDMRVKNALSHMATEMPNHILRNLLQGLFDTDGYADDLNRWKKCWNKFCQSWTN